MPAPARPGGAGPSLQVAADEPDALEEQRKVVTVLFADLSGSTPLAENLDPEELRAILATYFNALAREIQRFGGTVDKYIGDAVMAVFGAPVSREDDAIRAVAAAIEMQVAIARENAALEKRYGVRLALRIGINTGEVVAGLLAGEVQQAYTVVGDTVNTAQRLESVAAPNTILVSENTNLLARRAFRFEAVPPVTLKGKAEPVPAYRVLGRERRAAPREGPNFVGRETELERLSAFLRRTAAGEGQLLHIWGDAGVGKSRLVNEFLATMTTVGRIHARCLAIESAKPYGLIADLLRRTFHSEPTAEVATARVALAAGIAPLGLPGAESAVTLALEVLGYSERSVLEPKAKQQLLILLLRHLLRHRSDINPVVVIIEDVHWIDSASASALAAVVADAPRLRCVIISTSRDAKPIFSTAQVMPLEPLRASAAAEMVEQVAGHVPDAGVRQVILERAAGNPFFIEELARSLSGRQAASLPATIQDVLEARLDALPKHVRHVAQHAAVIGRTFRERVLAAVAPEEPVRAALETLQAEAFVVAAGDGAEPRYAFRHALLQEVAYQTLLLAQRRSLHGTVANAIETLYADRADEFVSELAYHYGRSDEDAKAVHWLFRAGDRAQSLYANEEALAFYQSALERVRDGQGPVDASTILERMGDVQTVIARYDATLESFHAARERASPDPVLLARLHRKVATALALKGAYSEALKALGEASAVLGTVNDVEAARIGVRMGEVLSRSGDYPRAREVLSRAVEVAESLGADEVTAEGLHYLAGVLRFTGELKAAVALYLRCLATYERLQNMNGAARVHLNLGAMYLTMGRFGEALAELRSGLSLAERMGNPWLVAGCHHNIGEVHSIRGDLKEAIASRQCALDIWTAIGSKSETALALMDMGLDRVRTGQVTGGRADLLEAEARLTAVGSVRYRPSLYRHLAYAELAAGDLEAAARAAERSLEYARASRMPQAEAMTQRVLGEIALARGDLAAARSLLAASRDRLAELGEAAELARTEAVLRRLSEPTTPR